MNCRRVMIAAPSSGSGKTLITCGLLSYLKTRGDEVRSFKCGPDYIDPMFHRRVIGIPGGNLDTFFSEPDDIRRMVSASGNSSVVIEGVMGLYDGIAGSGGKGSCYDVAGITETPVILVFNVKGMGETMLSVLKGILLDDSKGLIRGIVLNRISRSYLEIIRPQAEKLLEGISEKRSCDVKLLGGIPDDKYIRIESRHLGLKMPEEINDIREQVDRARDLIEESLDLGVLEDIMGSAGILCQDGIDPAAAFRNDPAASCKSFSTGENGSKPGNGLILAAARDEAFCFYYEENINMLRKAGLTIREFSPLHDENVPRDADGLLIGGGYPELHADMLSGNEDMRRSVFDAVSGGMPSMAECGGFMYLMDELECKDGRRYPMTGALRGRSYYTGSLGRFGYITVDGGDICSGNEASMISGLSIRGHEFHYYDSTNNGSDAAAVKPGSGRTWECIHAGPDHVWGYPHLYYPSCPALVDRLIRAMRKYHDSGR